jgi:hypothetical protein
MNRKIIEVRNRRRRCRSGTKKEESNTERKKGKVESKKENKEGRKLWRKDIKN